MTSYIHKNERNGKKWLVNECLQLQREFELLELSISEIATKHKRSNNAIIYKLILEGFANDDLLQLRRIKSN